jgi:hypothetical protein
MIKSVVAVSAHLIKKALRQRIGTTLERKLNIIADFESGKRAVNIELGIPPATVRTTVAEKQEYKDVAKLNVFLTFNFMHICMCEICINLINCC